MQFLNSRIFLDFMTEKKNMALKWVIFFFTKCAL